MDIEATAVTVVEPEIATVVPGDEPYPESTVTSVDGFVISISIPASAVAF